MSSPEAQPGRSRRGRTGAAGPLLLLGLALVALLLAGWGIVAAIPPAPVKLGLVAPFAGRDAEFGRQLLGAVQLALADRARAGAPRQPIELVAYDGSEGPDQAERQARKLAADPQTVAVLGHPSLASAEAARAVYRDHGIPARLTAPGLTVAPDAPVQAAGGSAEALSAALARFFTEPRTRQIVLAGGPAAEGLLRDLLPDDPRVIDRRVVLDPTVLYRTIPPPGDLGSTTVSQATALVYVGDTTDAAQAVRRMRAERRRGDFVFIPLSGSAADLAVLAGPDAGPLFATGPATPPNPEFAERFRAATGLDPWPDAVALYALTRDVLAAIDAAPEAGRIPAIRQDATPTWPNIPRVLNVPARPAPEIPAGVYEVLPDRYPGPLVAAGD